MEVDRCLQLLLEEADELGCTLRRNQSVGIFEGDDIGSDMLHLLCFRQEIVVGKDRFMQGVTVQSGFDTFQCGMMGIDGITDGTVHHRAITIRIFDS